MSKYEWKMPAFAKGIEPSQAAKELETIESTFGSLTPDNLLKASTNKSSLFHKLFTWDDSIAAHQYRLQQARLILNNIEVNIISDGQDKVIPVYEVIKTTEGNVYKSIGEFTKEDFEQVKNRTIAELNYLRNKLSFYKQFHVVILKIDEAINNF